MYVDSHAWAYMCACGDINTHITHIHVSLYMFACMCMHICYINVYI